jgi:hypothetical protein
MRVRCEMAVSFARARPFPTFPASCGNMLFKFWSALGAQRLQVQLCHFCYYLSVCCFRCMKAELEQASLWLRLSLRRTVPRSSVLPENLH